MSEDILEEYVRQRLETVENQVEIAWQGGEPTLIGLSFFKEGIKLVEKYRKPGQSISHTIQTNGLLIDESWCRFLRDNDFLVGLSIDGPEHLHDIYRITKNGKGTFDPVRRAWDLLQEHKVRVNILCAVHTGNVDHPHEVYKFFRDDLGAKFVQFIPIVERVSSATQDIANAGWKGHRPLYLQQGNQVTDRSVNPEKFGDFLCAIFDEWLKSDVGIVSVQTFDAALASWMGMPSLCIFSEKCGRSLVLEHNGDVYSCDHYVEPDYLLGNIRHNHLAALAQSEKQKAFGNDKWLSLSKICRNCDVLFACNGECPRNRFSSTIDEECNLNYLCAGYKRFFGHIDEPIQLLAELIYQRRPIREIYNDKSTR